MDIYLTRGLFIILAVLITASTSIAQTKDAWVNARVLSNGTIQNGHARLYDFRSYKNPNHSNPWTESGAYYRQGDGHSRDHYYKGNLPPKGRSLMEKRIDRTN